MLLLVFSTLAWSSRRFPPCEPIHQIAIQNVLSNQVSPDLIEILQEQQLVVDQDQQPTNSFEHSMTGLAKAGETTNTETPLYILKAETFIHANLTNAIIARKTGSTNEAFKFLGKAIHPLEDATSPAHKPFQAWKYNESLWEEIRHVLKEYSYPNDPKDKDQLLEKKELEGCVQYAYDIFIEKTEMPERFFDHSTGALELPPAYLPKK